MKKEDQIYSELIARLGIKACDAAEIVQNGAFDGLPIKESLVKIQTLVEVLGDYLAWLILTKCPQTVRLPLHCLKEYARALIEDGFTESAMQNFLAVHIDLLSLPDGRFRDTLAALQQLLPAKRDRHVFIKKKPAALRIHADHIRRNIGRLVWYGDANAFWNALCDGSDTEGLPAEETGPALALPAEVVFLSERLVGLGLKKGSAHYVASRFWNAFRKRASGVIEMFLAHGWSPDDITRLAEHPKNTEWRNHPERTLQAEQVLREAGFSPEDARSLVIRSGRFAARHDQDMEKVSLAVSAYRELGWGDTELLHIARTNPKALFSAPDRIRHWHADMLEKKREPLNYLFSLTIYTHASYRRRKLPLVERSPPEEPKEVTPEPALEPAEEPTPPEIEETFPSTEEALNDTSSADDEDKVLEVNWKLGLHELFREQYEEMSEHARKKFAASLVWMWDRSGTAPAALDMLAHWLDVSAVNQQTKKKMQVLRRIVTEKNLYPIMRLPAGTLKRRIQVLRAIVRRDFVDNPQLLLRAWETLPPLEIRSRVHEIEARGKRANRKPYLNMLLEPTREKFLARVDAFLKTL